MWEGTCSEGPGTKKEVPPSLFCILGVGEEVLLETVLCTPQYGSTFCKTTVLQEFLF
jgi:hypothetical protein